MNSLVDPGSFRDPAGYVFTKDNEVYRSVSHLYKEQYDILVSSGLLEELTSEGLLISHTEVEDNSETIDPSTYKIIKPKKISFISYPYEWSFGQLKDAALLTLKIFKKALKHNIVLKDATAFNVQFQGYKPVFIDTLSFDFYEEGSPWVGYRQFCQHFLAPLLLMAYVDPRANQLQKVYLDGIPLDLVNKMLPLRAKLRFSVLAHISLHSKLQEKYSNDIKAKSIKKKLSKSGLLNLVSDLESTIKSLQVIKKETEWANYYDFTNYNDESFLAKKELLLQYLDVVNPDTVWDMGANDGTFSRLALETGASVVSFDIDPIAVEKNYLISKREKHTDMLPLVLDLTNPTPSLGWDWEERKALNTRGNPDLTMALALIHHLAISNNVPLSKIANFFADLSEYLIIEFVPKEDSQVKKLLATRKDIFPDYKQDKFEEAFSNFYEVVERNIIKDSYRTLFLFKRK
jgi:hypothetical protein